MTVGICRISDFLKTGSFLTPANLADDLAALERLHIESVEGRSHVHKSVAAPGSGNSGVVSIWIDTTIQGRTFGEGNLHST